VARVAAELSQGGLCREVLVVIFVTVGTTEFDDLVRAMDELAPRLDEEVVMQIGRGDYEPRHAAAYFRFAPSLDEYYEQASIVVAHGGLATAMEVLHRGGKLIGVPNPDRYDRHQEDLMSYLADKGHLFWCRDLSELASALERVRSMECALPAAGVSHPFSSGGVPAHSEER